MSGLRICTTFITGSAFIGLFSRFPGVDQAVNQGFV
jgi:hypothetical protein